MLSRRCSGGERPHPHVFPATRGTGNFVVALLDAFVLSGERGWLDRAEEVLAGAFHPEDDIGTRRGSNDIERGWSYTVFLQSVLRFLAIKETLGETDAAYTHARRGFLAYAEWMLRHERPYLEVPERLEFPNDTWAAQDIRKHGLLMAAAAYDPDRAREWRDKAAGFESHVLARLAGERDAALRAHPGARAVEPRYRQSIRRGFGSDSRARSACRFDSTARGAVARRAARQCIAQDRRRTRRARPGRGAALAPSAALGRKRMPITAVVFVLAYAGGLLAGLAGASAWSVFVYQFVYFTNPTNRWWGSALPSLPYSFISVAVVALVRLGCTQERLREPPK